MLAFSHSTDPNKEMNGSIQTVELSWGLDVCPLPRSFSVCHGRNARVSVSDLRSKICFWFSADLVSSLSPCGQEGTTPTAPGPGRVHRQFA